MKMVADSLGRYDDIKIYDKDIEYSTKAPTTLLGMRKADISAIRNMTKTEMLQAL